MMIIESKEIKHLKPIDNCTEPFCLYGPFQMGELEIPYMPFIALETKQHSLS